MTMSSKMTHSIILTKKNNAYFKNSILSLYRNTTFEYKKTGILNSGIKCIGCGGRIWTNDLQVMGLMSYQAALPRDIVYILQKKYYQCKLFCAHMKKGPKDPYIWQWSYLISNFPWEISLPVSLWKSIISAPPKETLTFSPILKATPPKMTPVNKKLSILILIVVSIPAGIAL